MSSLTSKSSSQTIFPANVGLSFSALGLRISGLGLIIFLMSVSAQAVDDSELISQSELKEQIERENLRQSIDAQFEQLKLSKESGNAFNLELADEYFNYATLLSQAGYYQDANSAYQKAVHIQKTNHGINSVQQLPALERLFNNNFLVGNIENAENYINDMVRVEGKNLTISDKPSTLSQLKMGHYYLEKLKNSSPSSELASRYLKSANTYFIAVIEQNKDKKLSGSLFPYGELAMASYLGNQLERKSEKVITNDFVPSALTLLEEIRGHSKVVTSSHLAPFEDLQYNKELNQVLPITLSKLKYYYNKADEEGNIEEALKAALALGDLNYLSGRTQLAKKYFAVAWSVAMLLPENHPDRFALRQPVQLPAFKYAYNVTVNLEEFNADQPDMLAMPLQFDVTQRGAIKNVTSLVDVERKLVSRAKRELRKFSFRPAITEGVLSDAEEFVQIVAVSTN